MIANKPIRFPISLVHLAIAIFSFFFVFFFISIEKMNTLSKLVKVKNSPILCLFFIALVAFYAFISWQNSNLKMAKRLSYILSLFFIIEFGTLVYINGFRNAPDILFAVPTLIPALFVFLLTFSNLSTTDKTPLSYQENDNFLDIDFLIDDSSQPNPTSIWKINRIFSLTSFILSLLIAVFVLGEYSISLTTLPFPIAFLVASLVMLFFPKIGSWIFAVVSILAGIAIGIGYSFAMFTKLAPNTAELMDFKKMLPIIMITVVCCSLILLCLSLAMLLLSKEAKQEYKG